MNDDRIDFVAIVGDLGHPVSSYFAIEALAEYSSEDRDRLLEALESLDCKPGIKALREVLQIIRRNRQET